MNTRWREEEGSGTLLAVGLVGVVGVVLVAALVLLSAVIAAHRAAGAADLAALAGASRAEGRCTEATRVAVAHGATVTSCREEGPDVVVQVEIRPRGPGGGLGPARATARAGPA